MRKHKTENARASAPASAVAPTLPHPLDARRAAGLTREQVAATAGCSYGTVRDCEAQGRWPRNIALRRAYLAALGLTAGAA